MKPRLRRRGGVSLLVAFALFWGGFSSYQGIYLPGNVSKTTWINIPAGATSTQIADLLYQKEVIRSPFWFRAYLALSGQADRLQAGRYPFSPGQNVPSVVGELTRGSVAYNTVSVTFPEGYTVTQMAATLQQAGVCSAQSFMRAVKTDHFSYSFLATSYHRKTVRDPLEGFLFPDTYDFVRGESPKTVIQTMLQMTQQVLDPHRLREIAREGLTVQEVMTVASMIEREAKLKSERPLVASVIYNRLHLHPPMKLQIDATVLYALNGHGSLNHDLYINNPYNTYVYGGLPPGPIANPGLASIQAALHPAKTDYYFYVARNDGSGGHYFSTTYAQQLHNELRSQQNAAHHG
ncbi:endolytic transglycosylase MltG [Ferroacidibacillus organovorans]|uniref:endolytic transglycosylase MltG n=1 Tax=Ferroacidibacillus organovorans TaxID=1765683 RepID=UPI0009EAE814|nr:endolytic transglycosylase MltG [Ferroacidibacillus organovorans]